MRNREGRPHKLKIGLKYCGGCRAQYDRVDAVDTIGKLVGDTVEFVSPDDAGVDLLLVVTGCKTACVDVSSFSDRSITYIKCKEDIEKFICDVTEQHGGCKTDGMGKNLQE